VLNEGGREGKGRLGWVWAGLFGLVQLLGAGGGRYDS